jgi:hypothetical protein
MKERFITKNTDLIMICGFHKNHIAIYCSIYLMGHKSNSCPSCAVCYVAVGCICVIYQILLSTFSISSVSRVRIPVTVSFYTFTKSMCLPLFHYLAVMVYKVISLSFTSSVSMQCHSHE